MVRNTVRRIHHLSSTDRALGRERSPQGDRKLTGTWFRENFVADISLTAKVQAIYDNWV